jgi:transcriptional regulator with XRE-family HTH domain
MPRLKTQKPRSDPLKALMLQRKLEVKLSGSELAAKMGVSRQTLSEMLNRKSTDDWTLGSIKKACKILWISAEELREAIRT